MYSKYIEAIILRICGQPKTFEFILENLSGYDPIELLRKLKELESQNKLTQINGLWYTGKSKAKISKETHEVTLTKFLNEHIGFLGLLKKPHPLDFEWRNTKLSLDYLLDMIILKSSINDRSLFLGFPSLFAVACLENKINKVTLIERNKAVTDGLTKLILNKKRFQIIETDIFKSSPFNIGKFQNIVMDPPWYSPHFFNFMWFASNCVELGGMIIISIPSLNTRQSIAKERIEWFTYCQKLGMCLENLYAEKLDYTMPFFEFNAFRAAGIKDLLPFWRKGDLAIFRKMAATNLRRPKVDNTFSNWIEKEIDGVRIRVKLDSIKRSKKKLKVDNLVKGDILPIVTSRDSRRNQANIWTSGNRIFNTNDTQKFLDILNGISIKKSSNNESKSISDFIKTICNLEAKEYTNYIEWLYHEMERQVN